MRDLVTKIGRFCEDHVEKIVLVIVSVVCVWLFFTRVIFSPNAVTLDNRDFSPSQIDQFVYEQKAQELRANLQQQKTAAARSYRSPLTGSIAPNDAIVAGLFDRPLAGGFQGLFEDPLGFINPVSVPKPAPLPPGRMYASRRYRLPLIPEVTDVAVNHIRAAAYVPLEEITPQMTYDKAPVEPNDIDLITVEARFDTAELYRRYHASFAGVDVQKDEWRDPCLADPTFAALQLERQHLQEDGTWSDWRPLPRSRIEPYQKLFTVVEKMEDLPPGGLEVRLMQFDQKRVTMELLQPESYQIASAEEDWFPPSFYGKFKSLQRKVEMEERQKQREDLRDQTDRTADGRRDTTTARGGTGAYGGTQTGRAPRGTARNQTGATGDSVYGTPRGGRTTSRTDPGLNPTAGGRARPTRRGQGAGEQPYYDDMYGMGVGGAGVDGRRKTTDEVYFEFAKELVNYRTDLSKLDKPLLVWAFDDTARPGLTYRYRMRLGVFNPVAGTGQLVERDVDKRNQVILWSAYSHVTEPVTLHDMLYLFAKDAQERTKTATVEVARYAQGYWRTEDFQVKLGEAIGREIEPRPERTTTRTAAGRITGPGGNLMMTGAPGGLGLPGMANYMTGAADPTIAPAKVDYTTGKVLVDLVQVSDWGGAPNLRPRTYHDMLYTADGTRIEHMPVSTSNWPENLLQTYQYILSEKRREPQPFRAFSKGGLRGRGRRGGMEGMDGYQDMGGAYDDMMMDMGGEGAYGPYGPYP